MINNLSKQQCKAARDMLEISQTELGELAGVSIVTITRFEKQGQGSDPTKAKLQAALEVAGVVFIDADDNGGPGVRLKA